MNSAPAPYAATEATSRGRVFTEEHPEFRTEYQRDRDRIVHCGAFRRLEYKTQVFVNHEGDMFRTRLTHSIEVAQISRTIARALGLNEDLVEAIALAHDLGHTPFGHAGQDALNECMGEYGGFEHNLQSLRVIDQLEERYVAFSGLNLTFETREGILKHCSRANASALGDVGLRFLENHQPGLEAQVANLADEIAYNNHDVDDGLRSGLIRMEELCELGIFARNHASILEKWPDISAKRLAYEVLRQMINKQVVALVRASREIISSVQPHSIDDVRHAGEPLIRFEDEMKQNHLELKRFLRQHLYQHYRVRRMSVKAGRIIRGLFEAFLEDPRLLPPDSLGNSPIGIDETRNRADHARVVADYIAGMTDRYAIAEFERIFSPSELT